MDLGSEADYAEIALNTFTFSEREKRNYWMKCGDSNDDGLEQFVGMILITAFILFIHKTKKGWCTFLCAVHSAFPAAGTAAQIKSFGVEEEAEW